MSASLVLIATLGLAAIALSVGLSSRARSGMRRLLEKARVLPGWQESGPYRAQVERQRAANAGIARDVVLLVGDSLVAGFPDGLTSARGWVDRGISGDRVRHVDSRLRESVLSAACERVAVLVGTNDCVADRVAAEVVARDVVALVDTLVAGGRRVFLHTLPPVGAPRGVEVAAGVARVNRRLRRAAATRPAVRLVDLHGALAGPEGFLPRSLGEDGVHLSALAYERWAALLDAALAADGTRTAPGTGRA